MLPKVKPYPTTIYLDNAATTPVADVVLKHMQPFWQKEFGNPSALYKLGQNAHKAITTARQKVAKILGASEQEIIFTAGATESINLALLGIIKAITRNKNKKYHIISTEIEHEAVLNTLNELKSNGHFVTLLKPNREGVILPEQLKKAFTKETVLVSIMYANNEIGTVQPITEYAKIIRKENQKRTDHKILFHTDACQAAPYLDLFTPKLGVDLLTLNGSKIYGPKQTGILYIKSGSPLEPIILGGGQEKGIRSGTENVPGIIGFAAALEFVDAKKKTENIRQQKLQRFLLNTLQKKIAGAILNGPALGEGRLPGNVHISIPNVEGEALLLYLDSYNIAVSTGSACASASPESSHVLDAIGVNPKLAKQSIRFSLGIHTTQRELAYVTKILPGIVQELSRMA